MLGYYRYGTKRTWREFRVESVVRGKADIDDPIIVERPRP
jgi:hypothetical protein